MHHIARFIVSEHEFRNLFEAESFIGVQVRESLGFSLQLARVHRERGRAGGSHKEGERRKTN